MGSQTLPIAKGAVLAPSQNMHLRGAPQPRGGCGQLLGSFDSSEDPDTDAVSDESEQHYTLCEWKDRSSRSDGVHAAVWLAIASGFRIGNARTRKAELLLLRDFLLGQLGTEEDTATAQRIGRLLIAGGLHAEDAELPSCLGRPKRPRVPEKAQRSFAAAAADEADLFLAPLSCQLKLCILSGEGDCGVSRRLPQPALPFAIFPRCRRSGNLELWTNPLCRLEGELQVVGHAGQPLQLALRNASEPTTALEALLDCWRRQYLAPKWPEFLLDRDCLQVFRRSSGLSDPFAIPTPEEGGAGARRVVLFSGNCEAAAWERLSEPLLGGSVEVAALCVPDFTVEPALLGPGRACDVKHLHSTKFDEAKLERTWYDVMDGKSVSKVGMKTIQDVCYTRKRSPDEQKKVFAALVGRAELQANKRSCDALANTNALHGRHLVTPAEGHNPSERRRERVGASVGDFAIELGCITSSNAWLDLKSSAADRAKPGLRGSYGELIQALRVLKNVKDCRMYAALAVANLSTSSATHPQLVEEEVLRHLVPILQSEEVQEVIAYVLNALGNFACSWPQEINCLFCLANLTADPWHRKWMMGKEVYEIIWGYMQEPGTLQPRVCQCPQTLKTLSMDLLLHFSMYKGNAGMMMEKEVSQVIELAGRGTGHVEYVPIGVAIIANICESVDLHDRIVESPLFEVLTEHIHNDNTNAGNFGLVVVNISEARVALSVVGCKRSLASTASETRTSAGTTGGHVIRALMLLSLSPKYHHVILTTGAMANVCPIAMTERLSIAMRANALQMMAAVCATHPTTPTATDVIDLMERLEPKVRSSGPLQALASMSLAEIADFEIPSCELMTEKCIGSGCTSEVYKGFWTRIDTAVAIKQITEKTAIRPDEQLAFAREMKVLTRVQHENLVRLYGVCIDTPPLRSHDLIFPQQIKMCKDVAQAMCYLHTFDPMIIHRDLKSLNLLLGKKVLGPSDVPLVKVCDFGVAKLQAQAGQMTAQAGTKHWMAPEMWTSSTYDEKVDVFSYAMVVYEIICREVTALKFMLSLWDVLEISRGCFAKYTLAGVRPDMDAVPPDCPPELLQVMQACWAQDPRERPSFPEVLRLLEAI
ncbi:unnamed protein product [Symbiodinium sp. CCMP2592]|nr:unnamed protein product [Symbiodinium sp. CCMP2592]